MTRPTALTFGEGLNMKTYPEGIYFGMPFEEYLDIQCLSSSGIKNLLVCETDFWAKSWMNPLKEEQEKTSQALIDGRAYHKRILEGLDAFNAAYAPDYEDDGGKMVRTGKEITAALKACGAKSSFDSVAEGAARLKDADPAQRIMCLEEADHRAKYPNREFISAKTIRYMEFAARLIECDPEINTYFIGGQSEVTIIWFDDDYGVWFKIRFDYLKIGPACDFKTFANVMGKALEKAVYHAMASNRYNIQAGLYLVGNDVGKRLAKEGKVFGYTGDPKWLDLYAKTPCEEFRYIFQQKGISPVAIGGRILKNSKIYQDGVSKVAEAVERYRKAMETFGTGMWITSRKPILFDHSELPSYSEDL